MATDFDTSREAYDGYRYCYDNGHRDYVALAKTCFDMWKGDQWDALVKARLEREGRPALTFNVIESLIRTMKGLQCALRNDVRYLPTSDASIEDARVRDAIWLHTQQQNAFDFLESDMFEKGLIMARAYVDVRVSFDDSLMGHAEIKSLRSQDVVLDPTIDQYDPKYWPQVRTRRWTSFNDIKELFGKEKAEEVGRRELPAWYDFEDSFMAHQMGSMPYYHYNGINDDKLLRAHLLLDWQYKVYKRKELFVDMRTGDMSEIPETWDRNRIARVLELAPGVSTLFKRVPTVRWVVTCEQTVLHEEDSPYKEFTVVPYFPTFVDGVTKGVVESMVDPQVMFNKITSQELHIINTTANSGYKVKTGTLVNMTAEELGERGSQSGFVAEVREMDGLEKFQPNNIPQGHDRLSFKADQIIRSLSGVSNQARGFAREDVAGEAIMANQAGQDLNLAGWLSNLHRTKQLIATRVLDAAQAHYTETRVLMINRGSSLVPDVDTVTLNEPTAEGGVLNDVTRGKYSTTLVPSPSRSTLGESDFKMLLEMRKLGIAVPDAMLIELSPAANKTQIIQMLKGDSNERDQAEREEEAAATTELNAARAEKERTAAQLNAARATKFSVEAQVDPDASYERVEKQRMEMEQSRHQDKIDVAREGLAIKRRQAESATAVKLVEIEEKRAEVASRPKPSAPSKSGKPKGK